ncbi:MAG: DNA cytosine methyltransferase [Roseateles sp.]|uniref:DNA cytosine methyltransferase n=1 Tax=Roseateles sp. TaxID=1971397 RepID=UPI0040375827
MNALSTFDAIDLFAGVGGSSEGARLAGVRVKWAANHSPVAVHFHSVNHPDIEHSCQDVNQQDWGLVPSHDLQIASPSCTGHTPARGKDRPHHDMTRNTAWAVVQCAEYHRPAFCVTENVPAMTSWVLFPAWEDAMRRLGYSIARYVLDAADHGVPQNRERLFLVCSRSKSPIQLRLPKREHQPVANVIDWDYPNWSPIITPKRKPATIRRIAAGRAAFGDRFVTPYYSKGSGLTGRSIHRPIGSLTTVDRWAVIDGDRMRMLQIHEAKAVMGMREDYALPKVKRAAMHLLGNGVCPPVMADLLTALRQAA